jgi:hypothetical protein
MSSLTGFLIFDGFLHPDLHPGLKEFHASGIYIFMTINYDRKNFHFFRIDRVGETHPSWFPLVIGKRA